jgi:inward rectifier potassium channel
MLSPKDIFRPEEASAADDTEASEEAPKDLGFGMKVAEQSQVRLLNRDGSFNVERKGRSLFKALNPYHRLLEMSWPAFLSATFAAFVLVNLGFAAGFVAMGPSALNGLQATTWGGRLVEAFFFSVYTFTSVGYGSMHPVSWAAGGWATVCAFTGLLAFALVAGLVFARFARPQPQVQFSDRAVIAPYQDTTAFEFRIANQNRSHLLDVEAQVVLRWTRHEDDRPVTEFHQLELERDTVVFFPLHWTVVHPIDDESPLCGVDPKQLVRREAEFLIQLSAVDEASNERVHVRSSYRYDEVVCGAAFTDILERTDAGRVRIDLRELSDIEVVDDEPFARVHRPSSISSS